MSQESIQRFKVPASVVEAGDTGLFIGGGWFSFSDHASHGKVLDLPAHGSYGVLSVLGYEHLPQEPGADMDGASPAGPEN